MFKRKIRKSACLDISDRSIELIELARQGKKVSVHEQLRIEIPQGVLKKSEIKNEEAFDKAFNDFLDKAEMQDFSFKNINLLIPEELVEHQIIELEKIEDEIPLEEQVLEALKPQLADKGDKWQYEIIEVGVEDKNKYIFYGISREILKNYLKRVFDFGLNITYAEPESCALARLVTPKEGGNVIIDIGSAQTLFLFVFDGEIYKRTFSKFSSGKIIKEISKQSKLSVEKEEKFFQRVGYGSRANKSQKEILEAEFKKFNKDLEEFLSEIKQDFGLEVNELDIAGGLANMVGFNKLVNEKYILNKISFEDIGYQFKNSQFVTSYGGAYRHAFMEKFEDDINFLNEELLVEIQAEVQEEFEKKQKEILKKEMEKNEEDPEKAKLRELFQSKWGDNLSDDIKPKGWKPSLHINAFSEILILIILGIAGVFALYKYTVESSLEAKLADLEKESELQAREYFIFDFPLIVSAKGSSSESEAASMLGRFEETSVEASREFESSTDGITEEDIQNAKETLENMIRNGDGINPKVDLDEDEILILEPISYKEVLASANKNIGDKSGKFKYTLKAQVEFAIVDKSNFELIVTQRVKAQLKENETDLKGKAVQYTILENLEEEEIVRFNITVEVKK